MSPAGRNGSEYSLRPQALSINATNGERHARPPMKCGDDRPRPPYSGTRIYNAFTILLPHTPTKFHHIRGIGAI